MTDDYHAADLGHCLLLLVREWEGRIYSSRVAAWLALQQLIDRQIQREQGR